MNYFILTYETMPIYLEKSAQYRDEHLNLAKQHLDSGHLVMGGALDNPADKTVLAFKCNEEEIIKQFVGNALTKK